MFNRFHVLFALVGFITIGLLSGFGHDEQQNVSAKASVNQIYEV